MAKTKNRQRIYAGESKEHRIHGRLRCGCEDNIKIDPREIG
jgi:hypothetical protein